MPYMDAVGVVGACLLLAKSLCDPLAVFLFGLVIGSFLNVCILRFPRTVEFVLPASSCPKCESPSRHMNNIPVVSWLILGGKMP